MSNILCSGVLSFTDIFGFSRIFCVGKTFLSKWECVVRFHPGAVGILVAVAGWVTMLVTATSMLVGMLVALCYMIYLGPKQVMMGK